MRKSLLSLFALALTLGQSVSAANSYGIPDNIQDGNILHCFNWTVNQVKAELPNIAAAGYGSVQLSPMQRSDSKVGYPWHDLYRPYDLAFKGGIGSREELKALCAEAANYGIKIIVDVVANHVDKTAGYHDTWWDGNGRVRWNGGINYGDRYSITHGQLGDYGDVNSEDAEVCARGKAYVEDLKSMGVKGIRWDAAKHIGLPSEGCNFWSTVTSVSGMYHYGEILDKPGPNEGIIKEYGKYMAVTDNEYCDYAAKSNGGIPGGHGGSWDVNHGLGAKVVYWGESHDTYSNTDGWSKYTDQSIVDRAYAAYACRKGATALYLARPDATGFNDIKIGKGNKTAYKSQHIAAVNKFRNAMVGKADYFTGTGNACSITRQGGGAVIVMKGSGNVSIANGGGYCPAGTYKDMVSGGTFTVTASTISGNVGQSGIAVIMKDGVTPDPNPGPNPDPDPVPVPDGSMWILGNLSGAAGWATTPGTGVAMTKNGSTYTAKGVEFVLASGETKCYFNLTDYVGATWDDLNMNANRYGAATEGAAITLGSAASITKFTNNVDASACASWTIAPGSYDITADLSAMTLTVVKSGDNPNPNPNPDPDPDPTPGTLTITGDYNLAYSGNHTNVHYWGGASASTWPGVALQTVKGSDGNSYKVAKVPEGTTGLVFNTPNGGQTGDLTYSGANVMGDNGATTTAVTFKNGDNPNPNPNPDPNPGSSYYVYFDNSQNRTDVAVWAWNDTENCTASGAWPGDKMTQKDGKLYWEAPAGKVPTDIIISWGGHTDAEKAGGGDLKFVNKATYKDDGSYVENPNPNPDPTKPVVSASPATGHMFTDNVSVTLSATPAGSTIYYTLNGSAPTTSSYKYASPIQLTSTTTVKAFAVASDGTQGDVKEFVYTKNDVPNPNPGPTPENSLNTDYYKVNPNGQVGTNKTINVSGHPATGALSNWTSSELIAQGVARDVAQAYRGLHERPIVDSYALYAAYDNQNLYLGVQFVYTVWDEGGEGKQPGESKPYNMDGHMMIAFDLDPNKSFDGLIEKDGVAQGPIWNDKAKGAHFQNGVDAVLMCSTKPGVGDPGLFFPTPNGHASYDAPYCKVLPKGFYGYADGLLPSIDHIWGLPFGSDPDDLTGNAGFVDLKSEIAESAHTFYEFKIPLSLLGVTDDYIRTNGIGVMYLDKYGTSPVGGTPYDPSYFDNVKDEYFAGDNTSKEKEDEDIITYAPARIGKIAVTGIDSVESNGDSMKIYASGGKLYIVAPEAGDVIITTVSGASQMVPVEAGMNVIDNLARGFYVVNNTKVVL